MTYLFHLLIFYSWHLFSRCYTIIIRVFLGRAIMAWAWTHEVIADNIWTLRKQYSICFKLILVFLTFFCFIFNILHLNYFWRVIDCHPCNFVLSDFFIRDRINNRFNIFRIHSLGLQLFINLGVQYHFRQWEVFKALFYLLRVFCCLQFLIVYIINNFRSVSHYKYNQ